MTTLLGTLYRSSDEDGMQWDVGSTPAFSDNQVVPFALIMVLGTVWSVLEDFEGGSGE